MTEERIAFELSVEGADRSVADFAKAQKAVGMLDESAKRSGKTFAELGDVSDKVGRTLGQLSPQFASFANILDDSGKAVMGLTGVLGGVGGLAAGGLIAAIALYVEWQSSAEEATRKQTDAIKEQSRYYEQLAGDLQKLGMSAKESEAATLRQQVAREKLTPDQRSRLETRATMLEEQAAAEYQRQQFQEQNARDLAKIRGALSTFDDPQKRAASRPGSPAQSAPTLDDLMEQAQGGRFGDVASIADKSAGELQKANEQRAEAELRAAKELADEKLRIEEERMAALDALEEERFRQMQDRNAMMLGAMQAVGAASINALQMIAKGQKVTGRQIVASIGDTLVAEGQRWLFTGLARSLMGDPSGTALIGIGTAEIAAGIGMGAVGGSGAPSGAGAGMGAGPAEPLSSPLRADNGRSTHVVVNVSTLKADADLGRHVKQAVREADAVYGWGA